MRVRVTKTVRGKNRLFGPRRQCGNEYMSTPHTPCSATHRAAHNLALCSCVRVCFSVVVGAFALRYAYLLCAFAPCYSRGGEIFNARCSTSHSQRDDMALMPMAGRRTLEPPPASSASVVFPHICACATGARRSCDFFCAASTHRRTGPREIKM